MGMCRWNALKGGNGVLVRDIQLVEPTHTTRAVFVVSIRLTEYSENSPG